MNEKSYTSNYLKIYFWQGLAFIMRFFSLFIVTPFLTKNPTVFGIYSVCVSVTIFLIYADLGFLRATQKYAAESYAKKNRNEEMRYIGFGGFILLIFTLICTLIFYFFAIHPELLIKSLDTQEKNKIASQLLLILAIFTPLTILQRMSSMIFDIRLDGYINQRLSLLSSLVSILSTFYFFRNGNYDIIGYFLFSQILNFIVIIITFYLAKSMYNYKLKLLFKNVRLNFEIYKKTKKLAYSGLYIIIMWILFYELDQVVISKLMGPTKVAFYAIAFSFSSIFRSIFGILFSPFTVRANHLIENQDRFKKFCKDVIILCAPLVVIPTISFVIIAKPFVLTWVGESYTESILLARLFPLTFTMSFISYTLTIVLLANEKTKEMYVVSTLQPLIYWTGIMLTYSKIGILSFGIFKLIATVFSEIYCLHLLIKFLSITLKEFFKMIYPIFFSIILLIFTLTYLSNNILPLQKSKTNLFIVLLANGFCILLSFVIQYFSSTLFRTTINNIFCKISQNRILFFKKIVTSN